MKLWYCNYDKTWDYGAYDDFKCITKAETMKIALGLVLDKYKETDIEHWSVEELVLNDYEIHEISIESD